jgi:hypothetical protein
MAFLSATRCVGRSGVQYQDGSITSHVFFSLKHDESISSVWFLLLVRLLMSMSVTNDANLSGAS